MVIRFKEFLTEEKTRKFSSVLPTLKRFYNKKSIKLEIRLYSDKSIDKDSFNIRELTDNREMIEDYPWSMVKKDLPKDAIVVARIGEGPYNDMLDIVELEFKDYQLVRIGRHHVTPVFPEKKEEKQEQYGVTYEEMKKEVLNAVEEVLQIMRNDDKYPVPPGMHPKVKFRQVSRPERAYGNAREIRIPLFLPDVKGGNMTYVEYPRIKNKPWIGSIQVKDWKEYYKIIVIHEIAHWIQFRYQSFLAKKYPDLNFKAPHGSGWQDIYRTIRKKFNYR